MSGKRTQQLGLALGTYPPTPPDDRDSSNSTSHDEGQLLYSESFLSPCDMAVSPLSAVSGTTDRRCHSFSSRSSTCSSISSPTSSPFSPTAPLATPGIEFGSETEDAWSLIPYHVPWGCSYEGYVDGTLPGPEGACILLRSPTPLKNQRTIQACEKCRERKAKCSGTRPTCARCEARGHVCEYAPEPKRAQAPALHGGRHRETPTADDRSTPDLSPERYSASPAIPSILIAPEAQRHTAQIATMSLDAASASMEPHFTANQESTRHNLSLFAPIEQQRPPVLRISTSSLDHALGTPPDRATYRPSDTGAPQSFNAGLVENMVTSSLSEPHSEVVYQSAPIHAPNPLRYPASASQLSPWYSGDGYLVQQSVGYTDSSSSPSVYTPSSAGVTSPTYHAVTEPIVAAETTAWASNPYTITDNSPYYAAVSDDVCTSSGYYGMAESVSGTLGYNVHPPSTSKATYYSHPGMSSDDHVAPYPDECYTYGSPDYSTSSYPHYAQGSYSRTRAFPPSQCAVKMEEY